MSKYNLPTFTAIADRVFDNLHVKDASISRRRGWDEFTQTLVSETTRVRELYGDDAADYFVDEFQATADALNATKPQ